MKTIRSATSLLGLATLAALGLAAARPAQAQQLITNGGFETGDFTGWTVTNEAGGFGSFYNGSGTSSPLNGFATAGPAGGNHYAVTDQRGPGSHSLTQSFIVPSGGGKVTFSFDMFANNQSGVPFTPNSLDFNTPDNQQARVDLLSGSAGAFDLGPSVIKNFYDGSDAGLNPHPYTHYSFDITNLVSAGGAYQVRFAEVDNQGFFNLGVDNVSVTAGTTAAPEPSSVAAFAFTGLGALGLMLKARKRTAKAA